MRFSATYTAELPLRWGLLGQRRSGRSTVPTLSRKSRASQVMVQLALPCFERNMLFQVLRGSWRPVLVGPGAPEADLGHYAVRRRALLARTMRSRAAPIHLS